MPQGSFPLTYNLSWIRSWNTRMFKYLCCTIHPIHLNEIKSTKDLSSHKGKLKQKPFFFVFQWPLPRFRLAVRQPRRQWQSTVPTGQSVESLRRVVGTPKQWKNFITNFAESRIRQYTVFVFRSAQLDINALLFRRNYERATDTVNFFFK